MRLFEWVKNGIQAILRYWRPVKSSSDVETELLLNPEEEKQDLEVSNLSVSSIEKIEPLSERPKESEAQLPADSVTVYQVINGLKSLILSKENLPRISVAGVLTGLSTGFNFLSPYLLGEAIKLLTSKDETITIAGIELSRTMLLLCLVSAYTLSQVLPNLRDQVLIPVTENNTNKVLEQSTEHLLKKSLDYHVNTPNGDMIYLIQKGISLSSVANPLLTQIGPTLFEITIACTILSAQYGLEMGIGIGALLTAFTLYSALTAKPIVKARELSLIAGNEAWENFTSTIARYKTIHDFGKLNEAMKEVRAALLNMMQKDISAKILPLNIGLGHIYIARLSMLLVTLLVGLRVQSGRYTVQDFTVLVVYLNQLATLLPSFGEAVSNLFASYPDLKFVLGELQKKDEVVDLHPDVPLIISPGAPPSIEFDNVSFAYPSKPNAVIFHNLSFNVSPGEKVAFVSESGAGKTTIFNLLYGYYAPSNGVIKINGHDISKVSLKSLQSHISLLGQNPNLFKANVRTNICYGAKYPKDVSDEQIWELAHRANLYEFLSALKLDTDVGENGKAISGGQQQKVAILRGLLKESPIRLLDEITAPFDSQSAMQVLKSITKACQHRTTLMITHKLTEAQYVDKIIVIGDGQVIAQGPHEELLKTCPLYQKLWQAYIAQESHTIQNSDEASLLPTSSSMKNMMDGLGAVPGQLNAQSKKPVLDPSGTGYQFDLFCNRKSDETNKETFYKGQSQSV